MPVHRELPKTLVIFFMIVDIPTFQEFTILITHDLVLRLFFIPLLLLECKLLVHGNVPVCLFSLPTPLSLHLV